MEFCYGAVSFHLPLQQLAAHLEADQLAMPFLICLLGFDSEGSRIVPAELSCGDASLATLASIYGVKADLATIADSLPVSPGGVSLADLLTVASAIGMPLTACKMASFDPFPKEPFIIHVDAMRADQPGHFVVARPLDTTAEQFQLLEPKLAPQLMSDSQLRHLRGFSGVVLRYDRWRCRRRQLGCALIVIGVVGLGLLVMRFRNRQLPKL